MAVGSDTMGPDGAHTGAGDPDNGDCDRDHDRDRGTNDGPPGDRGPNQGGEGNADEDEDDEDGRRAGARGQARVRNDEGKWAKSFTDEELIEAVRRAAKDNGLTQTKDVINELDAAKSTVLRRLDRLWKQDRINRDVIGGAYVWSLPNEIEE